MKTKGYLNNFMGNANINGAFAEDLFRLVYCIVSVELEE